jgi:iron complex outermembrane recepter protein
MTFTYKSLFKATVALSTLCIASQAYAADAAEEETTAESANDIIVSARRIEERLQDVPISVAVVSQDQLTKANITNADDLARIVPGLNVEQRYSSENNAFAIRGFNQALRTTSSVGTYFAEVVAPRGGAGAFPGGDGAGPGNLFDLQNIQVLKGPQGTLFGRNTTGGAVMLVPRKPSDKFEGYVQGSYGNFNMFQIQGVLNVPISEGVRLRLGVDRMTRDGTQNNVSGIGPKKLNDVDYYALRGSLVLDVSEAIENYTIVSYSNSDHVGTQPQLYRANPATTFGGLALGTAQVARFNASGDPYQVENNLANPRSVTKQFQVINTTKWEASDNITIKNIVSYSSFKQGLNQSVFGSNWTGIDYAGTLRLPTAPGVDARVSTAQAFNGDGKFGNDQRSFTEELQIQGHSGDGRLQYQAGLYFEHSTPGNPTENLSISTGALCLNQAYTGLASMRCVSGAGATVNQSIYTIEYINKAVFAQATYAATDQLKLTAGFRLTNDKTRGTSQSFRWNFNSGPAFATLFNPLTNPTFTIPASQFVAPTLGVGAAACQAPNVPYASSDPATNCKVPSSVLNSESTRPTWTFNAQYNPSRDVMIYASYARGYRQGSTSPAAIGAQTSYLPEKVDSFELGAKTSWNGTVSGHFNATGFYSKLKDAQMLVGLSCQRAAPLVCPAGGSATFNSNAGKVHMYGIEFDGSVKPSDFFRLSFAGAWVRSRVDEYFFDPTPYIANFDVRLNTAAVGDPLPLTPEFGGNIAATFTVPTSANLGKIEFSAMYRYASSFSNNASNTNDALNAARATAGLAPIPVDKATPVKQIDLNLDWRDVGGQPIDLSIFATNVTDQVTYTLIQPLFGSFGFDVRYLGQPRMFGARVKIRF